MQTSRDLWHNREIFIHLLFIFIYKFIYLCVALKKWQVAVAHKWAPWKSIQTFSAYATLLVRAYFDGKWWCKLYRLDSGPQYIACREKGDEKKENSNNINKQHFWLVVFLFMFEHVSADVRQAPGRLNKFHAYQAPAVDWVLHTVHRMCSKCFDGNVILFCALGLALNAIYEENN